MSIVYSENNGRSPSRAATVEAAESAVHTLVAMRSRQTLSDVAMDRQGAASRVRHEDRFQRKDWEKSWLDGPTGRIAGGADEMLLNTIAEKRFGLPQDHRPDTNVPFRDVPRDITRSTANQQNKRQK
ncbi:MAG: hypothetical protein ABW213_16945 [Tardiphaga sp.]